MAKKPKTGKTKGQHVEVIARSRPLNQKELGEGDVEQCVAPGKPKGGLDTVKLLVQAGPDAPGIPGPVGSLQTYQFSVDKAFYHQDANEGIYEYLGERVLDHAFGGFNVCLLAYGQTGSGKTHTILGDQADPGLIPRLSEEIFTRIAKSGVRTEVLVEMVEIYGKEERMTDLLSDDRWGSDARLKLRQVSIDRPGGHTWLLVVRVH
jgi:kinesin family protein 1